MIIKLSGIAIVELQGILYSVVRDLLEFKDKRAAQILCISPNFMYQTLSLIVDLVKLRLLEFRVDGSNSFSTLLSSLVIMINYHYSPGSRSKEVPKRQTVD